MYVMQQILGGNLGSDAADLLSALTGGAVGKITGLTYTPGAVIDQALVYGLRRLSDFAAANSLNISELTRYATGKDLSTSNVADRAVTIARAVNDNRSRIEAAYTAANIVVTPQVPSAIGLKSSDFSCASTWSCSPNGGNARNQFQLLQQQASRFASKVGFAAWSSADFDGALGNQSKIAIIGAAKWIVDNNINNYGSVTAVRNVAFATGLAGIAQNAGQIALLFAEAAQSQGLPAPLPLPTAVKSPTSVPSTPISPATTPDEVLNQLLHPTGAPMPTWVWWLLGAAVIGGAAFIYYRRKAKTEVHTRTTEAMDAMDVDALRAQTV